MFIWIVIYSFFPSSDFVQEVVVLCGQTIFWVAVVVSVFIALRKYSHGIVFLFN